MISNRPMTNHSLVNLPVERIEKSIYLIRDEKVMIDRDLAECMALKRASLIRAFVGISSDFLPISCSN